MIFISYSEKFYTIINQETIYVHDINVIFKFKCELLFVTQTLTMIIIKKESTIIELNVQYII
jgi:hypothetical protein